MVVYRNRSTMIAPEALSNSYLIGSERIGTSMITLTSAGGLAPIGTRMMSMGWPSSSLGS